MKPAWVVVAPPNYAPNIIGWRTLYDLLVDVYVQCGWMTIPEEISFANDVLPILRRLSNLQWVNKGFAAVYGKGCPLDFHNDDFIRKLAQKPASPGGADPYAELRQAIANSFRPAQPTVSEPVISAPRLALDLRRCLRFLSAERPGKHVDAHSIASCIAQTLG